MTQRIRFGSFIADLNSKELHSHGIKVHIGEKPFGVLAALVATPGGLLTRERLQSILWPGDSSIDLENNLNAAVNHLRAALGDSPRRPRFVETVAGRGYRFIGKLRNEPNARVYLRQPEHLQYRGFGRMSHEELMHQAIDAALENVRTGGGPFGAVIARQGSVIAVGANQVTLTNDPTAHAEMVAIRTACRTLGQFDLSGCEMYTSCEPCPMCLGAIYWARLDRVYFGANSIDAAVARFDDRFIYEEFDQPHDARRIPLIPLMRDQAQAPFRAWLSKADRIPY